MIELCHYDAVAAAESAEFDDEELILIPPSTFLYQAGVPKLSFLISARLENNKLPDNQGVTLLHWESAYNDVAGLQTTNTATTTLLPSTGNLHPSFGYFVLAAIK